MATDITTNRLRELAETRSAQGKVLSVFIDLDPREFATPPARATEISSVSTRPSRTIRDADRPHPRRARGAASRPRARAHPAAQRRRHQGGARAGGLRLIARRALRDPQAAPPGRPQGGDRETRAWSRWRRSAPASCGGWCSSTASTRACWPARSTGSWSCGATRTTSGARRLRQARPGRPLGGALRARRREGGRRPPPRRRLRAAAAAARRPHRRILLGGPKETTAHLESLLHADVAKCVQGRFDVDVWNSAPTQVLAVARPVLDELIARRDGSCWPRSTKASARAAARSAGLATSCPPSTSGASTRSSSRRASPPRGRAARNADGWA